jgi:hypothetical protein
MSGHVDAHSAWRLSAVAAGVDLVECRFRRRDRRRLFATAVVLALFLWRRSHDVMFRGGVWAFAIFMMLCGVTRLLSILTLWVPAYGIATVTNSVLALIALGVTAAALLLVLPRILVLPTRIQLQQALAPLEEEVRHRANVEAMVEFSGSRPQSPSSGRPRRWKPSASSPGALRTTSTTS